MVHSNSFVGSIRGKGMKPNSIDSYSLNIKKMIDLKVDAIITDVPERVFFQIKNKELITN